MCLPEVAHIDALLHNRILQILDMTKSITVVAPWRPRPFLFTQDVLAASP
jgi:hypothetical protein